MLRNPADIWMVEESEVEAIKKHLDGENTIDCLNNALLQLFNEQKLMGISLKKIEGKNQKWILRTINLLQSERQMKRQSL